MTSAPQGAEQAVTRSLRSGFLRWAARQPQAPALEVGGEVWSYARLEREARLWARAIVQSAPRRPERIGVFASRSAPAYVGTLAALFAGAAYVPLNRTFPIVRTREMLRRAELDAVIVDRASSAQLPAVLDRLQRAPLVLAPEGATTAVDSGIPLLETEELQRCTPLEDLPTPHADDMAYLLFTSGSTGVPKAVGVTHANVLHFVDACTRRYDFSCRDRFSQTFEQTFDLSVFDLFVAWESGASVHALHPIDLLAPQTYVRKHGITVWFSVPSIPLLMRRKNLLQPAAMPSLRWSLFCGEPLPLDIATGWRAMAPQAILENLYGPTELTCACMVYRWDDARSPGECVDGIVPIGRPFDGLAAVIVDENLRKVPAGESGELCVCGPQVVPGYWRDPAKTAASFVDIAAADAAATRYYRTGDRVKLLATGNAVYLGRLDQQIKIHGNRVELGEIEAVLRRDRHVEQAVVLGWPLESGIAQGLVAFVSGAAVRPVELIASARRYLPEYMVPREVLVLDEFPLNANGKIDRGSLRHRLAMRDGLVG